MKLEILLLPDMPEVWVQGNVSGVGSIVKGQVNGGEWIPMNRRDLPAGGGQVFGYLLPLEPGTNVIVLAASDAATNNPSSKVLLVERSASYQAALTAPAFGKFANGQTQTVSGAISWKFTTDDGSELSLASLTVGGSTVTVSGGGGGTLSFSVPIAPPGCTNSVMPLIMELCWTNANGVQVFPGATAALAACPKIPLGLLEGYEIVSKVAHYRKDAPTLVGSSVWWPPAFWIDYNATNGPCAGQWVIVRAKKQVEQESFSMPCTATETNSVLDDTTYAAATNCVAVPALTNITAWVVSSYWSPYYGTVYETTHTEQHLMQPLRSLRFGRLDAYSDQVRDEPADGVVDSISREIGWIKDEGELVVRWPFYYAAGQVVLLTFEGVDYTRVAGEEFVGTNVLYQGQAPVAVSGNNLSYLVTCPGGGNTLTLNAAAFTWPESVIATNYVEAEWEGHRLTVDNQDTAHHLSFSGFHNGKCPPGCKGVNFFLSGAGHDDGPKQGTKYIKGFEIAFMNHKLCDFRDVNISQDMGRDVQATVLIYDGPATYAIVQDYLGKTVKALNVDLPSGAKRNLIGYSFGGSYAAGAAIYLDQQYHKKVDNLVLIGVPISADFLDRVREHVNNVIIITPPGDIMHPGMDATQIIREALNFKIFDDDYPHFFYARPLNDAGFQERREQLAGSLAQQGLSNCQ